MVKNQIYCLKSLRFLEYPIEPFSVRRDNVECNTSKNAMENVISYTRNRGMIRFPRYTEDEYYPGPSGFTEQPTKMIYSNQF